MRFPVLMNTDNGQSFGVTVPDLPGCFSAGDSMDDALDSAIEAIEGHVQLLLEDGQPFPRVKTLDEHLKNEEFTSSKGATWAVVDVPVERLLGPAEKLNITLPRLLLARIDRHVDNQKNMSRSGFLAKAALDAMSA